MEVAIRVDASRAIGTGHVRRMQALAVSLVGCGARVRFVARDLGIDVAAMLAPWPVITLPSCSSRGETDIPHGSWAGADSATDAAQTIAAIGRPDWIVIDHYGYDARWHAATRAATGARIAVVDDLADRSLDADLVIDHNWATDHLAKYAGRTIAPILGGPRFALLGPAYAEAPRYVPHDTIRSIGVFMGGVDAADATSIVLDAVASLGIPVEVVTTSANPHLTALRERNIALFTDLPDLTGFFARHDLQIGAGGGASWERCCIGAPALLLAVADNQSVVVPALAALGAVATAPLEAAAIATEVTALASDPARRITMAAAARALVDGRGAQRVALRMVRETLSVRPVHMADAAMMHGWRNHAATRAVSRDGGTIAWNTHVEWLRRVIADRNRPILIAEVGTVPVGVIRFDRADERAEVSLYLDPGLHGLGLGRAMLLAGERVVASGLDIIAEVLEGNTGSTRLFASAGYVPDSPGYWIKPARE